MPTLLDRIKVAARGFWLAERPSRDPELAKLFGRGPALSGVSVNESTALTYSAVWAAVSLIAGDVASLPLILYKRTGNGGKERMIGSKIYELLHDAPNPEMTSMVFRETLQAHVLTWGNGYAEIERDVLGKAIGLWPLTPDRVTPLRNEAGRLVYRVANPPAGRTVDISPANMLHVPGLGYDGVVGYSVIQMAREAVGLGIATERFGGSFFGNGTSFGGILTHPQRLSKEAREHIRESLEGMHQGVERAHKFIVLGEGMKYDRLGIPPDDAQFLETRKFQISEIARWFLVPPHKLGDLERATFSNIEAQDIEYYKSGLRRWLVRWEQELNRKLIPSLERRLQFAEHKVEGLLRGDSQARAEFYSKMFNIGAFSINQILELENENPIGPSGDVHYVPVNLMPADIAKDGPPKPTQTAPVDDGKNEEDERDALIRQIAQGVETYPETISAAIAAMTEAKEREVELALRITTLEMDILAAQQATSASEAKAAEIMARVNTTLADVVARDTAIEQMRNERAGIEAQIVLMTAERDRISLERDAAVETQKQTEAEARRIMGVVEHERSDYKVQERERLLNVLAAQRAVVVETIARMIRRETEKARRHHASADKLRAWSESFYTLHEVTCMDALRPVIALHLALVASSQDVNDATRALVQAHIEESQRHLLAVAASDRDEYPRALERLCQRWEQTRPAAFADRLLREEMEYASTLH